MSRLARAIEILEAINVYFQEGADVIRADALLLEGDIRIKDAIADCLESEEETVQMVPKSQRKHYGKNALGNWVGFVGKQKVQDFGPGPNGEEAALQWVWGV